ncbi:MAG: sortase [Eubacterium sp.]
MSDEKSNKHSNKEKKSVLPEYVIIPSAFVSVLLVLSIVAIIIAMKPVTELVHKVENGAPIEVRDIVLLEDNGDNDVEYGEYLADITCENTGLNSKVYYGANRISYRSGAGLSSKFSLFGEGKAIVLSGYDTTYFSALKNTEKGDIFTVQAGGQTYKYKVTDTALIDKSVEAFKENNKERLVLYSAFSDFSENKNKRFYVFADRIDGEAGR